MARRRAQNFLADVGGAFLRLSHRVPLVGAAVAIGCAIGWWYFRAHPEVLGARGLSIAFAVLAGFFAFISVVGLLRNLFPEGGTGRRGRS
jgi:hypothetical protein